MGADGHQTGDVRPLIARDGTHHPFTAWDPSPGSGHHRLGAGLIEKDQRLRGPQPPQGTRIGIPLRGNQGLFGAAARAGRAPDSWSRH